METPRQQAKDLLTNIYSKVNYNSDNKSLRYTNTKGERVKASLYDVCSEIWSYGIEVKTRDVKSLLELLHKK